MTYLIRIPSLPFAVWMVDSTAKQTALRVSCHMENASLSASRRWFMISIQKLKGIAYGYDLPDKGCSRVFSPYSNVPLGQHGLFPIFLIQSSQTFLSSAVCRHQVYKFSFAVSINIPVILHNIVLKLSKQATICRNDFRASECLLKDNKVYILVPDDFLRIRAARALANSPLTELSSKSCI